MNDEKKPDSKQEPPFEQYVQFEAAMRRILTVRKEDIVDKLPKMFQERVADARNKRAKKAKKKANL